MRFPSPARPMLLATSLVAACGSSTQSGNGTTCYTFDVPSNVYDTNGKELCEVLIRTSGPAACEPLMGIDANMPGTCPSTGLLGCCVNDLANEGDAPGTRVGSCWYSEPGATAGKAGCTGPNNTWQSTPP